MATFNTKKFLNSLTERPGVYQMLDGQDKVLYVGKAKNLKKRLSSYFRKNLDSIKTRSLMGRVADVQVTVTPGEAAALLLEQNLIKAAKPPYNILLRDDKSYPFIVLTEADEFPALRFHRGKRQTDARYFGPFPNASAVRETLQLLQKTFQVRQCEDSVFNNRSRPCLQYQIGRCKGPCVGLIADDEYTEDVRHSAMFLEGKDKAVVQEITQAMEAAAAELDFEKAAKYRDQLKSIRQVQSQQPVWGQSGNLDVIAAQIKPFGCCVQLMQIRGGRIWGSRSYYPKARSDVELPELLSAFVSSYYLASPMAQQTPYQLVVNAPPEEQELLENAIREVAKHRVSITHRVRGQRAEWLRLAEKNAEQNLTAYHAGKMNQHQRSEALQVVLGLQQVPRRMECFDISHTRGEGTVASCVVFDNTGPLKSDYRRYIIEGVTPGDDYAAMSQALTRRYKKGLDENKVPDILFVDGGKGQLSMARQVLENAGLTEVALVGVAKGSTRKPGLETLWLGKDNKEVVLPGHSPALHLIQHIRDEAHRFAITHHRQRRGKVRSTSPLEQIPGVGPKRRKALLLHFGGLQELESASAADIARIPGVSLQLAEHIYGHLHNE